MWGIGMKMEEIFKLFLSEIEKSVSENVYNLWYSPLKAISLDDDKFTIQVPMIIHKQMLSKTYKDLIDTTLFSITNKHFEMIYLTEEEINKINESSNKATNKKAKNDDLDVEEDWETNLIPRFTFDNFVVGDSNKLAVVSAHTVAEHPGQVHNPLFLYGKSGIGKTHLMHAIGNYIHENSDLKVLYVTSDEYIMDYTGIAAVNKGADSINYAKSFKDKYKNVDVLLIDDIQFLVVADKSQQEFFNTFNALFNANKQIVISSDRSPDDLKKLEDRLRSRFMMGLPVDIYPPDFNLRCKIINSKIKNTPLEDKLSQDVIEYIANSCQSDVRHIEGSINRLLAYTAMMVPAKIDLNFAVEALKDYLSTNVYSESSISKIQKAVADYFNITVNDLKSKKKTSNIAKPRHIAIYLSRVETDEGLARIGLEFGGRDHSTISASIEKISNELKTDEKMNNTIKEIKNKL